MGKLKTKAGASKKISRPAVTRKKTTKKPTGKIKTILISQPKPESERNPYSDLMKKYEVQIDFHPFIVVEGISAKEFRKFRINPTEYTAVVFNSKNAVDHFFRICEEMRMRMSQDTKYFCISEAVALYLQKYILYRKRKVFFANGKESELIEIMRKFQDSERFLLPCSDVHKEGLYEMMKDAGFEFDKAIIYRTVSNDLSELKKNFHYDLIVFFSPLGVKSLFDNFPKFKQGTTRIAAFGKSTAKAVMDMGLRLDLEAPTPEYPSMVSALDYYLSVTNKKA
ncbi:MAG: uroporphyrinogen III methyltransferase [Chitinophagales bacterium]|nr:MAG: uroporphyrinogen III methyltransferase [Chitinophagales bacterium]